MAHSARAVAGIHRHGPHGSCGGDPLARVRHGAVARSAEWEAAASDAVASVVAALSGYGVAEDDTDRIRFVRAALHGFVDLERSGGFALPASVDESFAFLIDALDATLRALGTKASIPP